MVGTLWWAPDEHSASAPRLLVVASGSHTSPWSLRNASISSLASSGLHRICASTHGALVRTSSNIPSHPSSTFPSSSNCRSTAPSFSSCPAVAVTFFSSCSFATASSSWQSTTHSTVRHIDAAQTKNAHMSALWSYAGPRVSGAMYPAVPGPCSVIRRFPSSGSRTAVPQSVKASETRTTSPARPRATARTNRFFALRSRQTTRASLS